MSKLQQIRTSCAGADVGSAAIFIGIEGQPVKQFDTYTGSLQQDVSYVKEQGITDFAMEATGVYWISFYDMLTAAGIKVHVVNGRHVKHVPGRKSDTADCMWIQQVHSYGGRIKGEMYFFAYAFSAACCRGQEFLSCHRFL